MTETIRVFEILCFEQSLIVHVSIVLIILIIQAIAKSQLYVNESLSVDFIIILAWYNTRHTD